MGALATHQRSSTILDKGPSSDFRMTFSWGLCTFTAHLSRPRSITLSPYLQTWICPWPQTLQLLKQHTAWTLLTATRVVTILDNGIWGRCHTSFSEPYYHAWLTTLEKFHHFQHYVADIDNLSKWPECHLLAEEVSYWKSASKGLNIGLCVKHTRMITHFLSVSTPFFSTLVVSDLSHCMKRW